jgi:Domain of unknown function (DUF4124)
VRVYWLGCLALLAAPLWGGEIYRTVDANGNVRYSDRPEGEHAERLHIVVPEPTTPPAAPSASEPSSNAAAQPAASEPETTTRPPTEAEKAEEKARNCSIATERLERYQVSHRLYRSLPDGEREYLSDEEIDQARSKAAAEAEKWCN